ncbi:MAG TPA: preprotein translocase subunit SecG [Burkholderiales bacterium]|jgi:preprotein translocase subunit SecG|nr:preprotein translocase subunit SecG [Burkholderiales bacterium]
MEIALLAVHVVVAIAVVGLVLLQHGKGADAGAAFGGGASGSMFGATGSANFLSRATAVLATIFFLTSMGLTYLASHQTGSQGVMSGMAPATQKRAAPVAPKAPVTAPAPSSAPRDKTQEIPK